MLCSDVVCLGVSEDLTSVGVVPPLVFGLDQNRPDPFSETTRVSFSLDRPGMTRLRVYDVSGRLMATLIDRDLSAGRYQADWRGWDDRGGEVPSGVYFFRLELGSRSLTRKAILLR